MKFRIVIWSVVALVSFTVMPGTAVAEGTWKTYTTGRTVMDIASEGNYVWFTTDGGVYRYDGETWTTYVEADGLVNNTVRSIAIDSDGAKWFGTDGGASRYGGETWATYTTKDGFAGGFVSCVTLGNDGVIWIGGEALSRYDGKTWTMYIPYEVRAIAVDNDGVKWISDESGLSRFDDSGATSVEVVSGDAPSPFSVRPPYPNPFNPQTTISYTIRQSGDMERTGHVERRVFLPDRG